MPEQRSNKAGVIGWPVKHSLSPALHQYWLKRYTIEGSYTALAVAPEELGGLLAKLEEENYCGINVTIPHKQEIMPLLYEVDENAAKIGAVNTVVRKNGKWIGRNTDSTGFANHLKQSVPGYVPQAALVLGAGGAARAVVAALHDMGCKQILLANRTKEKAVAMARNFEVEIMDWEEKETALGSIDIVVNATSLSMAGQQELEIDLRGLSKGAIVADIVYKPLQTALIRQAQQKGFRTIDGLGMLIHQAAPAFAEWFGVMPEIDEGVQRFLQKKL